MVDVEVTEEDLVELRALLGAAGMEYDGQQFQRIGSAKTLYHWDAEVDQEY